MDFSTQPISKTDRDCKCSRKEHQASVTIEKTKLSEPKYQVVENLDDCIEDTADNYAQDHTEHYCLCSDIFEPALFSFLQQEIEKLTEEFSTNPQKFINDKRQEQLNTIAQEYLIE